MVAIEDIESMYSLEKWLIEWPAKNGLNEDVARAMAVAIAHRTAMRVLPVWWSRTLTEDPRKGDVVALLILRRSLISGVAAKMPTPNIRQAATLADTIGSAIAGAMYAGAAADAAGAAMYAAGAAAATSAVDARASAVNAAFTSDAATSADLLRSVRADCTIITDGGDVLAARLWPNHDNPLDDFWQDVKTRAVAPEWSFWIKWYDGALAGRAPNWQMLEQIALIEAEVWEDGAEAVGAKITLIEEQHELATEVSDVRKSYEEIRPQVAALASRSHNNPPELIEAKPLVQAGYEIIWSSLAESEEELEKDKPSASVLKRLGRSILEACNSIASYCASLGDTALKKAAQEVGGAGGKWTVRGIAVYLAAQNPGVQSVATRLVEYGEKLAHLP
ncbi:MAG: hypothetical protein L3J36_13735 [Rhodobacteraceae bacterium]|nr:hypothetical protein [Paracoccaceae bacterium]